MSGLRRRGAALAWAAHASEPSRDDVLRAQEQQRQQLLREVAAGPAPSLRGAQGMSRQAIPEGESPCFAIDLLRVVAVNGDPPWRLHRALQDEWAPLRGRCLGAKGLDGLLFNLSARMQEEGWITSRLDLPAQNLEAGELLLRWTPGLVESVRSEPPESRTWRIKRGALARRTSVGNVRFTIG